MPRLCLYMFKYTICNVFYVFIRIWIVCLAKLFPGWWIIQNHWNHLARYTNHDWLVVWNIFYFPYIGNNDPNWLIFFRGVETTNQLIIYRNSYRAPCIRPLIPHIILSFGHWRQQDKAVFFDPQVNEDEWRDDQWYDEVWISYISRF